jgi:hypothetical protein
MTTRVLLATLVPFVSLLRNLLVKSRRGFGEVTRHRSLGKQVLIGVTTRNRPYSGLYFFRAPKSRNCMLPESRDGYATVLFRRHLNGNKSAAEL